MKQEQEGTIEVETYPNKWEVAEHKTWQEVKEDGWEFEAVYNNGAIVVMSRNGYLNRWRIKQTVEKDKSYSSQLEKQGETTPPVNSK